MKMAVEGKVQQRTEMFGNEFDVTQVERKT